MVIEHSAGYTTKFGYNEIFGWKFSLCYTGVLLYVCAWEENFVIIVKWRQYVLYLTCMLYVHTYIRVHRLFLMNYAMVIVRTAVT